MSTPRRFIKRLRAFIAKPIVVVQQKPVLLNRDEFCRQPIFLVGVHRSGTSLVRRMFNSHPEIACPPESFFIRDYCMIFKNELNSSGFKGFGYSHEDMRCHIARQAGELHEAFRLAQGKRRWADKTPQYTDCLDDLAALYGAEARFVLIFRDPRDIACSIYERKWRFIEGDGDLLDDTIEYVNERVTMMRNFLSRRPEQAIALRYDRLVEDPSAELGRIMPFLGENFHDSMVDFNQGQNNFGTEDPMVRGTSRLRYSGGYWVDLPQDERSKIEHRLKQLAGELGYPV